MSVMKGAARLTGILAIGIAMNAQAFALTMTGSTTVFPVAQHCAEIFSDNNPQIKVSVRGGGSGVGIAAISDRTTDIGMSSRLIKTKEIKDIRIKGVNPVANVIAWDGIAVIVNPSNEMSAVTIAQLKNIFSGKTENWADFGLKKQKIVIVSRDSSSGTFEAFNEFVLKGEKVTSSALMQASNQAVANVVSSTPGAIGYVGMGYLKEGIKALSVNGVMPAKGTVKSRKYPLSRPLFMYTNGTPKGDAAKFIDFVMSSEGQSIVEEEGFVTVK
jgi:phosphate transport system substrate-binding protein